MFFLLFPVLALASTDSVNNAFTKVQTALLADFTRAGYAEFSLEFNDKVAVAAEDTRGKKVLFYVNQKLGAGSDLGLDQWTSILCHESGHILGGAPYLGENQDDWGEVSAEGQADYFAASKCLRRLWTDAEENKKVVAAFDSVTVKKIKGQGCETDQCVRIVAANFDLLKVVDKGEPLSLTQRSTVKAKSTHASRVSLPSQCRLDTSLAGALCSVDPMVPFSPSNQKDGACVSGQGARPACWFAPVDLNGSM